MKPNVTTMTQRFYDDLAPLYHLIFVDWEASIAWQADILDRLIRDEWGDAVTSVLDVACGIGTHLSLAVLRREPCPAGSEAADSRVRRRAPGEM